MRLGEKGNCEPQAESSPGPGPEDKQVPHQGCRVARSLFVPRPSRHLSANARGTV